MARVIRRTAKILGLCAAGTTVVGAAAVGLFLWRLAQGPIPLDPFIPMIEEALRDPDGRFHTDVGELVLSLESEEAVGEVGAGPRRIDLRARRVRAVNADGVELAAAPEMGIGFSIPGLFLGKLVPTRLEFVRPRVQVLRRADGSLAFDIRSAPSPEAEPAEVVDPNRPDPLQDLLESLRGAPDLNRPMGALRRLSVTGADLTMVNRMLGLSWHAKRADIVLTRDAQGTEARARLALDLSQRDGDQPVTVGVSGRYRNGDATTDLVMTFDALNPAALAAIGPALAPLAAVDLPVSGRTEARLDERFRPTRVGFDLKAGAGRVAIPELHPQPLAVAGASARGQLDLSNGGRALTLDGATLALGGEQPVSLTLNGTAAERDGRRNGSATLSLTAGGRNTGASVTAEQGADGGLRAAARWSDLRPDALAGLAPALAPLAGIALPLAGTLDVTLDSGFRPVSGAATLTAGAGRITHGDLFDQPLPVVGAELRVAGERGADGTSRLRLDRLALGLGDPANGPRIEGTAGVEERGGTASVTASVTARGVPLDDLRHYWPKPMAVGARGWVTENVTTGVATEASASAELTLPLANPAAAELTRFRAELRGENASVRYFHHLPPATGVAMEAVADGKTFAIQTKGGRVGEIEVGDGAVLIDGLDVGKETIDIRVPVSGGVRPILTLLDTPPLSYPSKLELDPKRTQGTAEAMLHFAFPLLADLTFDHIALDVAGKMRGVGVEKVAAGMNATDGTLSLALDLKSMAIKGTTKLDGIPVNVDWKESFESQGTGPRTRIAVKGMVDANDLRSHGIDLEERVIGPMGADILFTVDRRHKLALTAAMNLEKTRLSIAELGWEKPPGQPGTGKLTLEFDKDRPTRISGLTVDAGGLKAQANLELADGGRRVARVVVPSLKVGQTDLRADVTVRPKNGSTPVGYAGTISGDSLYARKLMGKGEPGEPPPPPEPPDVKKNPLDLDLKFNSVVFGDGRRLRQVAGTVRRDANAWTLLDITARSGTGATRSGNGGAVSLSYKAGAKGLYDVAIRADDLGAALSAMDINDRVRGGQLAITGRTTEPRADSAIEGHAEILNYSLIDVPVLARLLNAISPSGFAELLEGGKGVNFGRMVASFRKKGPALTLVDLRTTGSALGLTLEGDVDLDRETANLRGTIVPIYGLNRLVGQIPLLGDLLSGGEGQGIFSATWRVRGRLSDPDVTVNPLAILAPGFLRNLFFLGEGEPAVPPAASSAKPEPPASGLHER